MPNTVASVFDVAAFIEQSLGVKLEPWRLQKLVYYSQAWSLAWGCGSLFSEEIQAWKNGPACPALWRNSQRVDEADAGNLSEGQTAAILAVLDVYGKLTGRDLVTLSHLEKPWRDARGSLPPAAPSTTRITQDAMRTYYGPLVENQGHDKRIPRAVRLGIAFVAGTPEYQQSNAPVVSNADGEEVLSWLENGEGDPWRES